MGGIVVQDQVNVQLGGHTASRFRERFRRPDVIDLVLRELNVDRAEANADVMPGRETRVDPAVAASHAVLAGRPPVVAIMKPQEGAPAPPAGELDVTYTVEAPADDPATLVRAFVNGDLAGQAAVIPASVPRGQGCRLIVTVPPDASLLAIEAKNSHGWSDRVNVSFSAPSVVAPASMRRPTATLYLLGDSTAFHV